MDAFKKMAAKEGIYIGEIPEGFPSGLLPLYPEAKIDKSFVKEGEATLLQVVPADKDTAFAWFKKGWLRILLSVVIIIWGVFAMQYDVKVAAPLLAIGTVLFFMGIMNRISDAKQAREEA